MTTSLPGSCDVAVIGSGVGGLTAAALLAEAGLGVCVLERESRPGGYLAGFSRKQFKFDTAIHWLNQCSPGGIVHKVFDYIGGEPPQARPLHRIRRYHTESHDYLLTSNPDELKEQWLSEFPQDRPGIEAFFGRSKVLAARMLTFSAFSRTPELMGPWEKLVRGLKLAQWSFPFWSLVRGSTEDHLRRYFVSDKLRSVFGAERDIISCMVPFGWAYMGDYQVPPEGGSRVYVQWLVDRIHKAGSDVALRTGVARVLLENGQACGVALEDGRELRARYVVAACDVETLLEKMLPPEATTQALLSRYRKAELYSSCVSLSLGLSTDPRALGFDEEMISLSRDGLARHEHSSTDPVKTDVVVFSPSVRDPTLAPPGKGTLTIYASADIRYGDFWKTEQPGFRRGEAYRAFKEAHAQALVRRVEEAISPQLGRHIEVLDVATPVTHLRYTGNKDGTIMGQVANRENMRLKISGNRTPVPRLFLAGYWAEYGGGVPMAVKAAANTALLVLRREKANRYAELTEVLDRPVALPTA